MASYRWIVLPLLLVALFILNLATGSISIPIGEILSILAGNESQEPVWIKIIWDFRMTKALTCILAGSALAVSGLQMQTLFRNALAGPDVLGISSGASLAVSLVYMGHTSGISFLSNTGSWGIAIAATVGSASVFLVMIAVAGKLRDNVSLLIVGLMIGAGTSSIVSVLQFVSQAEELQNYMIWTFGSLGSLSWPELQVLAIVLVIGAVVTIRSSKILNAWLLGHNYAQSLGVKLKSSRLVILFSACILTGAVTAFCGPIAFVGLAVPHLIKILVPTHNHRILVPAVMAGGAVLLLFCDIIAQLPGGNTILPVNAITSLIGAPVVIWVILKNKVVH